MRRFLLCSATFLFLAVNNINGCDDSEAISPLVKELCKYLIHFKRKNFREEPEDMLEVLPKNGTICNNDTSVKKSSEPLEMPGDNNKYLEKFNKQNTVIGNEKLDISKKECNVTEESEEVQKDKFETDSQNLQLPLSLNIDPISENLDICNEIIVQECHNFNHLDTKNDENCSSKCHIPCPEGRCEESNKLKLDTNHNGTCIWRRCPFYMCLEYFLPYFKRCKLQICKHHQNISEEDTQSLDKILNSTIGEDCHLSCQNCIENNNYTEECSEYQDTNQAEVPNTTDLCEEPNSTHTTKCCTKHDEEMLDKQCCELNRGIRWILKNLFGNACGVCNRKSSDSTCNITKESFQDICCEKKVECSNHENASRVSSIPQNRNLQNGCCFRIFPCPALVATRTRCCHFINNYNLGRNVPQICCTNCLVPATHDCNRMCKKDDKKSCCESDHCTTDTNNSNESLCSTSFTSKQDCNHTCLTRNNIKKLVVDIQANKANVSDLTIVNPGCKCIKIVFHPVCNSVPKCDSEIIYKEPNPKPKTNQVLHCQDSCSDKTCFDEDDKKDSEIICKESNPKPKTNQMLHCQDSCSDKTCFDEDDKKDSEIICKESNPKPKTNQALHCQDSCSDKTCFDEDDKKDSKIIYKESNPKPKTNQALHCQDSCSDKICFDEDEKKELDSRVEPEQSGKKLQGFICISDPQNKDCLQPFKYEEASNEIGDCQFKNPILNPCQDHANTICCDIHTNGSTGSYCDPNYKCQEFRCSTQNNINPCIKFTVIPKSEIGEMHDICDKGHSCQNHCGNSQNKDTNDKTYESGNEPWELDSKKECLEENKGCIIPINLCSSDSCTKSSNPCHYIITTNICNKYPVEDKIKDSCKCKKKCCCLITKKKDSNTNCTIVSSSELCKIYDTSNKKCESHCISEVSPDINTYEDSEDYNGLSGSFSCKNNKTSINNSKDSSKKSSINCILVDHKYMNLCKHGANIPKLCNLCQIISVVKHCNNLTNEPSKKINSVNELSHKNDETSINDCNDLCAENTIDCESGESDISDCEVTNQRQCNNEDLEESTAECNTKQILSPVPKEINEPCSKINADSSQNLENNSDTIFDPCKDFKYKDDSTTTSCDELKIKFIPNTKKKLIFITCNCKNISINKKDRDYICPNGDISRESDGSDESGEKLKQDFDLKSEEEQCSTIQCKTKTPTSNHEINENKSCINNFSEHCCAKKEIEEPRKSIYSFCQDGLLKSLNKDTTSWKDATELDCKHLPISYCHHLRRFKMSPRHWLTSRRYNYRRLYRPILAHRKLHTKKRLNCNHQVHFRTSRMI